MIINKTKQYLKDYDKKIVQKHLKRELEIIEKIEYLLINSENLKSLLLNPLSKVYNIEKKKGDLKEYYTARINQKIRLYIKPIGMYPYNEALIVELDLIKIDNKHYGNG